MKLIIDRDQLKETPVVFLRRAGYGMIYDRHRGQESFVRRLGGLFYPRFHVYIAEEGERVILNLHLDQKQSSYAGSHMHSGEYDGELVEQELTRIKSLL